MLLKDLPYDKASPVEIEEYAKKLIGKTFREILPDEYKNYKGKGRLGQITEKYHFKYEPNSDNEPDFNAAGVELKVTPFKENKRGKKYSAKERLVLNIINYMDIVNENFASSTFWRKNKLLLLIFYLYKKELNRLDYTVEYAQLFEYPEEDLKIIKDDWEKIVNKIREGKAHELSEGDTFYLGACTKGANKRSLRKQPFSDKLAKQRALSLKNKYMTHVLNDYMIKGKKTYEPIIKNVNDLEDKTFEQYVLDIINSNHGKSVEELAEEYSVKNTGLKNFASKVALRMLGVNTKNASEFAKANIKVKAIRIERNGKIKEHMSFPTFKFKEIVQEKWTSSKLREMFIETKFFFVIFKFDEDNVLRLHKGMFWNMPLKNLDNEVKKVWRRAVEVINEGIEIRRVGKRKFNNFPSPSENRVAHVRPHARNRNDTYPLPNGEEFTKQCFWLNNSYVLDEINKEGV